MPNAQGGATLEEAVVFLNTKPTSAVLAQKLDIVAGGLSDAAARLANCEQVGLENKTRLDDLDTRMAAHESKVSAVDSQHAALKTQIDAQSKLPDELTKKVDDLNTRVRAIEGAVGSANYKAPKPVVAPVVTPVVPAAPSTGFRLPGTGNTPTPQHA